MPTVAVYDSFDDMRFADVRFLHEASRLGEVHVVLWPDEMVCAVDGRAPKFPLEERSYFVQALRFVGRVSIAPPGADPDRLPEMPGAAFDTWAMRQTRLSPPRERFCQQRGIACAVICDHLLTGCPPVPPGAADPGARKVLVTGCYDWLHSGHIRFFEEAGAHGVLYVVVGNDANVAMLKGPGHPKFPQDERRYMVQAVRYVHEALIAGGMGWLDAESEIQRIRPDIYIVNEDGDRPEKRDYCRAHGIEYVVLRRLPKPGLPRRQSTVLRGF